MTNEMFTDWINEEVKKRGWSFRELSRRAGISSPTISQVMNNQANPGLNFCTGIAQAFNIRLEDVLRKANILQPEPEEVAEEKEVLRLLRERTEERARVALQEVTKPEQFASSTAEQIIHTMVHAMMATYHDMGPVYRATAAQACVDQEFREHRQQIFHLVADRYAELLAPHRERITATDPERAIDLGFALMVGLLDQRMLFGPLGRTDVGDDELADELVALASSLLALRPQ